jgi:signal transduction histidine kinase
VTGIVYSIYKYRINQLKKLLAIRTKISRDLHDEVGSTLTSINILSKISQSNLEKDRSKTADLLEKITEQSANMQQSMSDIVWSIHPDKDKIENLVIRMREYLGQTAEPKNILVEFLADEKILKDNLTMQHRRDVFLIFKEAVNNAVKYSQGKKIAVFLGKEDNHIKLSIQDDGLGFHPGAKTSSSGLKNMHDRAKELKGTLHIQSSPGNGTKVELLCPAT